MQQVHNFFWILIGVNVIIKTTGTEQEMNQLMKSHLDGACEATSESLTVTTAHKASVSETPPTQKKREQP